MVNEQRNRLAATHQCTICGARWRQLDDGHWTLCSKECGQCCDNAPMGEQIEALEDVAPWSAPLSAEEKARIDHAWQIHRNAVPADVARLLERIAGGGPNEWGYRDPVTGDFIADDDVRLGRQCAGNADALLLPA